MTHRILEGNVGQVVKGLRQTVTKRNLSGSKAKILLSVAAYFHRNRDRMRYNDYLAQGLPIASGSVEGACKNLIKDRMERSGMRWTQSMAEAVVKLRALYLSGDFNTYWDFHIREDQHRLYPQGRWAVVECEGFEVAGRLFAATLGGVNFVGVRTPGNGDHLFVAARNCAKSQPLWYFPGDECGCGIPVGCC